MAPITIRAVVQAFKDRIHTERDKAEFKALCDKYTMVGAWERPRAMRLAPTVGRMPGGAGSQSAADAWAAWPCCVRAWCIRPCGMHANAHTKLTSIWLGARLLQVVEFPANSGIKCLALKAWLQQGPDDM